MLQFASSYLSDHTICIEKIKSWLYVSKYKLLLRIQKIKNLKSEMSHHALGSLKSHSLTKLLFCPLLSPAWTLILTPLSPWIFIVKPQGSLPHIPRGLALATSLSYTFNSSQIHSNALPLGSTVTSSQKPSLAKETKGK